MKIDGVPFEIPEDSPWFKNIGGEWAFSFKGFNREIECAYVMSFNSFGLWPPSMQALCAAVAAMEWRMKIIEMEPHIDDDGLLVSYNVANRNRRKCTESYYAARERMKGERS